MLRIRNKAKIKELNLTEEQLKVAQKFMINLTNETLFAPQNGPSSGAAEALKQSNITSYTSENGKLSMVGEPVTTILARIVTHDINNAGTDAHVYLGIGGREFYIDSDTVFHQDYDDFERGDDRTYSLGEGGFSDTHNVLNPGENDPRQPYALDFGLG